LYSIVLAVVLAIFNYIYYAFITPDTIEFFLSEAKNYMLKYPEKFKAEDIPRYLEGEKGNFSSVKLIPPVLFFGLLDFTINRSNTSEKKSQQSIRKLKIKSPFQF
jgi:hypothetical protein